MFANLPLRLWPLFSLSGSKLYNLADMYHHFARFSEFGSDGGPAAKALRPKYNRFVKHVSSHLGIVIPHIEVALSFPISHLLLLLLLLVLIFYIIVQMKHILASTIFLKGFGGLLFILSSSLGAYLLVCIFNLSVSLCILSMGSERVYLVFEVLLVSETLTNHEISQVILSYLNYKKKDVQLQFVQKWPTAVRGMLTMCLLVIADLILTCVFLDMANLCSFCTLPSLHPWFMTSIITI